jgi:hypothetical protein
MSIAQTGYTLLFQITLFTAKEPPCRLKQKDGHTNPILSILHGQPIATKADTAKLAKLYICLTATGNPSELQTPVSV